MSRLIRILHIENVLHATQQSQLSSSDPLRLSTVSTDIGFSASASNSEKSILPIISPIYSISIDENQNTENVATARSTDALNDDNIGHFSNAFQPKQRKRASIIVECVEDRMVPKVDLSIPQNLYSWLYMRLIFMRFGTRLCYRLDCYIGVYIDKSYTKTIFNV